MTRLDPNTKLERARRLAEAVAACLGLEPPRLASEEGVERGQGRPWYLIGLIGGKEVGKSALINALVGKPVAETSSYGPGTELVLAYVHKSQAASVRGFLRGAIGDRFETIEHDAAGLERQVLLDLPDMDSHFSEHVELSRAMVRLMEYPIWIASVEKYADAEPAKLLQEVARGNSPENFIYCLNKVDQARRKGGERAVEEIREDYTLRLTRLLELESPPRAHLISALFPEEGDFPALKAELSRDKSMEMVERSRLLAVERRCEWLLAWIGGAGLAERIERLERFLTGAENELAERVGRALYETAIPRIEADKTQRAELTHRIHQSRAQRWPFVNLIEVALGSAARLLQFRSPFQSTDTTDRLEALIEKEFSRGAPHLEARLGSAFARIQASQPEQFSRLFSRGTGGIGDPRGALRHLRTELLRVLQSREERTLERFARPSGGWGGLWRFATTFGAVLWFPLAQPLLLAYLSEEGLRSLPLALVSLLGVSHLLQSAALLGVYFLLLWAILKWIAGRRVERMFARWASPDNASPETSLYAAAEAWLADLPAPARDFRDRMARLEEEFAHLMERDAP